MGVPAELQIHTQAMWQAKELAHTLYQERQSIVRNLKGNKLTVEQKRRVTDINKQMRDIFRKAGGND